MQRWAALFHRATGGLVRLRFSAARKARELLGGSGPFHDLPAENRAAFRCALQSVGLPFQALRCHVLPGLPFTPVEGAFLEKQHLALSPTSCVHSCRPCPVWPWEHRKPSQALQQLLWSRHKGPSCCLRKLKVLGSRDAMESSSRCSDAVTFKPMYRNPRLLRTICFFHACLSSWVVEAETDKNLHQLPSPESPRASSGSCPRSCKRAETKFCCPCGNAIGNSAG